ncbi:MAG: hypothetical protein JSU85_13365 [Candidatus Zixiibacteriota bacterium]|nr:MAG: hypothetical protein JSU85_13365 [candidate division Zixibacteria bacterium]
MKNLNIFTFFTIICCISNIAVPQQQAEIYVTVVDGNNNPLPNVGVRISHIISQVSDDNGEFSFVFNKGVGSRVEFVLETIVVNHDTLIIYEPLRGVWTVVKDTSEWKVKIILLPKGDHRLLSKEELKLLIKEMVDRQTGKKTRQLQQLEIENGRLKKELLSREEENPLGKEAERLGFTKDELLTALEKMKEELKQSDDPYEIGLAALYEKKFPLAEKMIEESIETDEQIIEEISEALPDKYLRLGEAYIGQAKLKEAEDSYRKVIELRPEYVDGYFNLAKVLYIEGNLRGALENLQSSLRYYKETDDSLQLAHIKNNLGFLILSVGNDPEEAISKFIQARAIYEEYNSEFEQLAIYNNLTFAYNMAKYYEEALKTGTKGLELFENKFRFTIPLLFEDDLNEKMISDSLVQEFSYRQIQLSKNGDFYVNPDGQSRILNDNSRNKKYFIKRAENRLVVIQYPGLYAQLKNNIGCAYNYLSLSEKKEENLELAIRAYMDALEIRQKSVFPLDYANQNFNLGWAYEHLDNEKQDENLVKALEFYNKALYVYRELELSDEIEEVKTRIEVVQK